LENRIYEIVAAYPDCIGADVPHLNDALDEGKDFGPVLSGDASRRVQDEDDISEGEANWRSCRFYKIRRL
jgi:hypothetical protein